MEGGGKHPPPPVIHQSKKPGANRVKSLRNDIFESSIPMVLQNFQTLLRNCQAKIENPVSFMRDFTECNYLEHGLSLKSCNRLAVDMSTTRI